MICPVKDSNILVSFEMKEKTYSNNKHFCRNNGWVAFGNSQLISGNIAKKTIGDGSKSGLLYVLFRDCDNLEAAHLMDRWAKFCSRYFGFHRGFSIGISDVTPSDHLKSLKHDILSNGYRKAKENIKLYENGELKLRPGCDSLQSLEEILNGILGNFCESAGQEAMKALPWSNSPRIMAECGSKGSPLNISQMIACVGQQDVGGNQIQDGLVNRTLVPHFEYHSLTPAAKGFVANSFYTGLTAVFLERIFLWTHQKRSERSASISLVFIASDYRTSLISRKSAKINHDIEMHLNKPYRLVAEGGHIFFTPHISGM